MLPFDQAEGKEAEILSLYSQLQYNNTFDKKQRLEIFSRVS